MFLNISVFLCSNLSHLFIFSSQPLVEKPVGAT